MSKKTDLTEPHMIACGNQKACCWVGSAGCQLSALPHSHGCAALSSSLAPPRGPASIQGHSPELWAQASVAPRSAHGICVCRRKARNRKRQDLQSNQTTCFPTRRLPPGTLSPLAGLPYRSRKTSSPCRQESHQDIEVI